MQERQTDREKIRERYTQGDVRQTKTKRGEQDRKRNWRNVVNETVDSWSFYTVKERKEKIADNTYRGKDAEEEPTK